jgi:hypothetical protein
MSKYICHNCGTIDDVKHQAQGSLIGEIGIWLIAILAAAFTAYISIGVAIIFSLWRAIAKKKICAACGQDALVDVKTPRGKKLVDEYSKP